MGYSYGRNERGNWALACDNCGDVGGVRKRPCPHMVLGDSHRTVSGQRHQMSYCPAPALCAACYAKLGGLHGVHGEQCREGAAAMQARYDATEAALNAGELLVTSAGLVKDHLGLVRVTFAGRYQPGNGQARQEVQRIMPADVYDFRAKPRLSDYDQEPAVIGA